jgi:hypothetical protein
MTEEQFSISSEIIEAVLHQTDQIVVLQGSTGTGKTFTVKALIRALELSGKSCLICGTTGIAAAQYPGATTVHSLFHLGKDEQFTRSFRSNVGRDTPVARHILAANLIIVDEVLMLTAWVTNQVSMALRSISDQDKIEFGGKYILFVSDLLQLPPVVSNLSLPVVSRLIMCLSYWPIVRKFQLQRPMLAPDPLIVAIFQNVSKRSPSLNDF